MKKETDTDTKKARSLDQLDGRAFGTATVSEQRWWVVEARHKLGFWFEVGETPQPEAPAREYLATESKRHPKASWRLVEVVERRKIVREVPPRSSIVADQRRADGNCESKD